MTDELQRRRRKLSAIMMADVCGFSRMMGRDDERTVDLIRDFHRRVRTHVEACEGRIVDTSGDSFLGEFDSVVNAVGCARRIQDEQAGLNAERPAEERIDTRIGVHLGDVIVEDYNVYGDGVNIAARLEPLADPGGICLSEAVFQQVRDRIDLPVEDLGLRELKNIQYPVRVFRIPPRTAPPAAATAESSRPGSSPPLPMTLTSPVEPPAEVLEYRSPAQLLQRPDNLILLVVAAFLLASPRVLFSTAGVFPAGGAILGSIVVGKVWSKHRRSSRYFLLALGVGIASAAAFTNWSRVTNVLFVLGGAIVAAAGMSARR
jgi:class 3 adenylate cyclase